MVAPELPGPANRGCDMTRIFIATLLAFTAVPALADQPATTTANVQVADLDLSTASGQRALDRRLTRAVIEVCGAASDADLAGKNDVRRCRADTLASLSAERDQRIAAASTQPIEVASR